VWCFREFKYLYFITNYVTAGGACTLQFGVLPTVIVHKDKVSKNSEISCENYIDSYTDNYIDSYIDSYTESYIEGYIDSYTDSYIDS